MKRSVKIMLGVVLGLVVIFVLFLVKGDFLQGLMRPAYDTGKCYDSDGGKNYETQGTVYGKMGGRNSKTQFADLCNGNTLTEYYCDGNKVKKKEKECTDCYNGACTNNYGNCSVVLQNGSVENNYNFIIAFYDLDQQEMNTKAFDYARAQFYRSEYDQPNKTDINFGFSQMFPNWYFARAGLFEIEPFKSSQQHFNIFYINHSFDSSSNPYEAISNECPFVSYSKYNLKVLKHQNNLSPNYNTWDLEQMGNAFNHEMGHDFGLYDEYFTEMGKNDLTQEEVEQWNNKIPNCDYSRPFTDEDYESGDEYCQKWCEGVDASAYEQYDSQRELYDSCNNNLHEKENLQSWMNFCTNELDFSRFYDYYGFYKTFVVAGTPGMVNTKEEACQSMFGDTENNEYFEENIQTFCYEGTVFNIWDLDIGENCTGNTGCFAGCGGFSKDIYPAGNIGAFGDAFRPSAISIMGGGPYGNSGPDFAIKLHQNDNELPTYGKYDEEMILNYLQTNGIL